jgi:hypothetical protein
LAWVVGLRRVNPILIQQALFMQMVQLAQRAELELQ